MEGTEVFYGVAAEGLRWIVRVSDHDDRRGRMTMLHIYRGDKHLSGSGFGRSQLRDGQVLNQWRGRTDDQPWFVMACAAPEVTRVVSTTDRGAEVELALSPVVRIHGVRYAVADLPRGHGPGSMVAEVNGTVVEDVSTPAFAPPRGAHRASGWTPKDG